nr:ATP-binding protein [uncultured Brevundimonas sp.]
MTDGTRKAQASDFGPALDAQKTYARERRGRPRFGLMVPEAFVRGIRDIGYRSNADALAELIDNALQAFAERVDVLFGYDGTASTRKPTQIAVVDNGHGMEPDMMRMAVMWGGTHRENDRRGLGRYGYGLPSSSVSLGRRFTVLSQTPDGALWSVAVDLDAITAGDYTDASGDIIVPEPQPAEMPPFVARHIETAYPEGLRSGTVILIDKLDRLEWTTAQGLRDNLRRQFGVTYHKLRHEAAVYVDGVFVDPIDPLFLTEGFHLVDLDQDRAQPLEPVRIELRAPDGKAYLGAVTLRYAWFPPSFGSIDKARDAVGLNANPRFSILRDFHGVIFSRNGRLIDVQARTPWTVFINNDRYIKVEVEFSASLDEAFGVTTSKQQVTVSPWIWDRLKIAGMDRAIEQLRHKVKEAKIERRLDALSPSPGDHRLSERVMALTDEKTPPQGVLALDHPYEVLFDYVPEAPFFRFDLLAGVRLLRLNTAHRFYGDLYDAPGATAEMRAALEVLLFSLGNELLVRSELDLEAWSRRLDLALAMLGEHLRLGGEEDFVASS